MAHNSHQIAQEISELVLNFFPAGISDFELRCRMAEINRIKTMLTSDVPRTAPVDLLPADEGDIRDNLVKAIHARLRHMNPDEAEFTAQEVAFLMCIPVSTLQEWAQGRPNRMWKYQINDLLYVGKKLYSEP